MVAVSALKRRYTRRQERHGESRSQGWCPPRPRRIPAARLPTAVLRSSPENTEGNQTRTRVAHEAIERVSPMLRGGPVTLCVCRFKAWITILAGDDEIDSLSAHTAPLRIPRSVVRSSWSVVRSPLFVLGWSKACCESCRNELTAARSSELVRITDPTTGHGLRATGYGYGPRATDYGLRTSSKE